ncbi:MAG: calycin-like domain-containing protein [Prevotella sp.]
MKKIFTLIAMACLSLTAVAEDYTCNLAVTVYGEPSEKQVINISCTKNEKGKYDITLKDFSFGPLPVGTINVKDIDAEEEDGNAVLTTKQDIVLEEGTFAGVPIPIVLEGYIWNGELAIRLKVPSVGVNVVLLNRETSIYGGDFEAWHKVGDYDEPNGWHGIKSGTGLASFAANGVTISDDVPETSKGTKSVKLQSTVALGISANGTITTGRMAVGDIDPKNTKNNAFIDPESTDVDGNGDPFFNVLKSRPTSLSLWYKFKNGEGNENPAMVKASLVGEGYYQDPEPAETTYDNLVAVAEQTLEATDTWKKITIPFDYASYVINIADPASILVTINTCSVPGGGSKSTDNPDVLLVDDVQLNYEPVITSIELFDTPIPGFSQDKTEGYKMTVAEVPEKDEEEISVTCKDDIVVGTLSYYEPTTNILSISCYNEALDLINTYKVELNIDPTGVNAVEGTSNNAVVGRYNINGQSVSGAAKGMIITKYANGTVKKTLK